MKNDLQKSDGHECLDRFKCRADCDECVVGF